MIRFRIPHPQTTVIEATRRPRRTTARPHPQKTSIGHDDDRLRSRPARHPQGNDMLAVMALTLLASANLIDVYGSVPLWAGAALPSTVCGVALAGAVSRSGRYRWCRSVVGLAGAQFVLGPVAAELPALPWRDGHDSWVGGVPESPARLLGDVWRLPGSSFRALLSSEVPVGAASGSLMVAWTVCLWVSFLAACAVLARPGGRRFRVLATVVVAAGFVLCALLGTGDGEYPAWTGTVMALLAIRWCASPRCGRSAGRPTSPGGPDGADGPVCRVGVGIVTVSSGAAASGDAIRPARPVRLPSGMGMTSVAVAAALVVCALLPQHRFVLRDGYIPDTLPYAYTSPLSGMRSVVRDLRNEVLLTVTGLPSGVCVRLAVMDDFDGSVWNLSGSGSTAASADDGLPERSNGDDSSRSFAGSSVFRRIGSSAGSRDRPQSDDAVRDGAGSDASAFSASFTVHDGLSGPWLPVAGTVLSLDVDEGYGSSEAGGIAIYGNRDSGSFIVPAWPDGVWRYAVDGVLAPEPSPAAIEESAAAHVVQPQARHVPDAVEKLALSVAGGAADGGSRGGRKALLLASWLREHGWFSHGLSDDYPSAPGHGSRRLAAMVEDVMVGDSEQYASLMALMARSLGLPSRVVLGFVPDDDAVSPVEFTGDDLEAWVEIALEGWGWVSFRPTPQESQAFDGARAGSSSNDKRLRQPAPPLVDPPDEESPPSAAATLGGERAERPDRERADIAAIMRAVLSVVVRIGPVWMPLLACACIMAWKARIRSRERGRGPPRTRVLAAWASVCDAAVDGRVPLRGTRSDRVEMLADRFPGERGALTRLARQADRAAFAPFPAPASGFPSASGAAPLADAGSMSGAAPPSGFVSESMSDEEATACWRDAEAVRRAMLDAQPPFRRLAIRLSTRSLRARFQGCPHPWFRPRFRSRHPRFHCHPGI
ncbi:transglutaminase-like domain-containing protein [Bifidobacterium samirii]|uniref:Transglutaminase n=1 Tax=Bifidobacterium samirii TaxID=2306974 RepID=A0A430FVQ8_9BIFI|nr:transglutaminase-like domain-containing protein [Bifidobacterium samirii]RSX58096.1 transglutaminase [Bifidobacterium samirii]